MNLKLLIITVVALGVTASTTKVYGEASRAAAVLTVSQPLSSVLAHVSDPKCSLIFISDAESQHGGIEPIRELPAEGGLTVLEARQDRRHDNTTQPHLSQLVAHARLVRQTSRCVTLVVVSDDPAFLASFAHWSLKGGLLVWSTRLVLLTRLPLQRLHHLHRLLSTSNAILLLLHPTSTSARCSVYVQLPYTSEGSPPLLVASWTPRRGLALTSALPLFPDKSIKFDVAPTLVVAIEALHDKGITTIADPGCPGGYCLNLTGIYNEIIRYVAEGMNFTYRYVRPFDRTFGRKLPNGSWTGIVRMIVEEEADLSPGGFIITLDRNEDAQFVWPFPLDLNIRVMAASGRIKVNPWGFLFPLEPVVWACIGGALALVLLVLLTLASLSHKSGQDSCNTSASNIVRGLFQQDLLPPGSWLEWERVLLGVWLLMTLVLTRSYAGNLISLLAVRHIPQPYHSLRPVIDNPSVRIIIQKDGAVEQYIRSSNSGIFSEVAKLEESDRIVLRPITQFLPMLDTLVHGGHVLLDIDLNFKSLASHDFLKTGKCKFYLSKKGYMQRLLHAIVPKHSMIVPGLNKQVMRLWESGLGLKLLDEEISHHSTCASKPKKVIITKTLGMDNSWGIFVVLVCGLAVGAFIFLLELLFGSWGGQTTPQLQPCSTRAGD